MTQQDATVVVHVNDQEAALKPQNPVNQDLQGFIHIWRRGRDSNSW